MDEEHQAARALSAILMSAMLRAYEEKPERRKWLYCWEQDGLRWLIRFQTRRPWDHLDSEWIPAFLELNRQMILSDQNSPIDFNLRAARLAKEALSTASKQEVR